MFKPAFFLLMLLASHVAQAETSVAAEIVDPALQTSLTAFFAAKPSAKGAVAELINVPRWPNIIGKVRWSLPNLRTLPARVSLIAERGSGKSLRRWYVTAHVKWMRNVVTLKQDISARTMLDRSMLQLKRKNIAGLRGQTWSSLTDVSGLKSLTRMRRGDVVVSSMVKRPPLIKRGDHVTILVSLRGIQVRAEGIALKSGSRGDRMLVQNVRSKQKIQSIVQNAHTVSVAIGGV